MSRRTRVWSDRIRMNWSIIRNTRTRSLEPYPPRRMRMESLGTGVLAHLLFGASANFSFVSKVIEQTGLGKDSVLYVE